MRKIIVGSRRSKLAMTQTKWVIKQLEEAGSPFQFDIKEIVTKGDRILDVTLSKVGGKGLFVKEIENALLTGTIDMAVHSMKDMPSSLPDGLVIGSIPKREDYRDVLISKNHQTLEDLKPGSVIGTSSLRRSAQILKARPDLEIKWIRGNIDTRLKKLETDEYDAILLAAAGLLRMGWTDEIVSEYLDKEICLPAVGQGALSIECREDDTELKEQLAKLNDEYTSQTVRAERTFLEKMQGGCQIPIAGYATMDEKGMIELTGFVGSPDGKIRYVEQTTGLHPEAVGMECAEIMLKKGAGELIDKVKEELDSQ
ncbi:MULTISPECIES: hydroxymethylbilane synthase [Bacillus]|uniref:Porphobilinogen deaminase n=2 Tax=Bacillus TaxID=1386 RepID=A0A0M4FJW1_9BACI|nr:MULTISPECIES: hydroxymethylbilane synthase [Bacillus]ALC81867.1 porphobilinogen deaminase [Bacillus gobiensis]MBP1083178.1 hydroxymethylbilane synthase [Bacillus capparidis]MED1097619.1 hydroxymethylbilane synthase [Bacillus capparidis]